MVLRFSHVGVYPDRARIGPGSSMSPRAGEETLQRCHRDGAHMQGIIPVSW